MPELDIPKAVAEAKANLERAIKLCTRRTTYQDSITLCSSTRSLWARYYNAWFQDTSLQACASEYKELFNQAIEALRMAVLNGNLESTQQAHVHLMIRNTKTRQDALDVIQNTRNRGEAVEQIDRIYNSLESEKVDANQLSVAE